jgi:hypothetical protein
MADYRKLFEQELMKNQNTELEKQLEEQIMRPGQGPSLAPTLGLVDHFTGSKFAAQAPEEADMKTKLSQLLQMRQGQQNQRLSGLGKLAQMQGDAESAAEQRAFQREMMNLKRADMLRKAGQGPKLGAEDKQKLGYTTTLLKELPKLQALYKQGGGVARPGFVGSLIGQNDAEILINALAENYGRLQSGGAISKDEEDRFKLRLGTMMDSPEIRQSKLQQIMEEIQDKHNLYGGGSFAGASRSPTGGSSSMGGDPYEDLSDDELSVLYAQRGMR